MTSLVTRLLVLTLSVCPISVGAAEFGVVTKLNQGLMGLSRVSLIRQAGVDLNRDSVSWGKVERVKGVLSWDRQTAAIYATLKQNGIRSTVILSTGNRHYDAGKFPTSPAAIAAYARFAAFAARELRGQTVAFEIGNEWRPTDIAGRRTTMVDYVNLFVAAANAIHAADPSAKVVADPAIFGGLPATSIPAATSTIGAAARRGLSVADGVVVHQYPYQFGSAAPYRTGGKVTFAEAQAFMTTAMTKRAAWLEALAGRPMPLYVTEYGWPLIAERNLTIAEQATQMAESTRRLAEMPFVKVAIAYELIDSCTNKASIECTFGLFERKPRAVITAKPALHRFRRAVGDAAR